MRFERCAFTFAIMAAAMIAGAPSSQAGTFTSDVVDWVAHNGPSAGPAVTINDADSNHPTIPGGTQAVPVIPAGANYVMMAPINPLTLADPGDYIKFTVNVQMFGRTTIGTANLNNNLRFGIFSFTGANPDLIEADDVSNHGLIVRYGNGVGSANHLTVMDQTGDGANPFTNGSGILLTRGPTTGGSVLSGPATGDIAVDVGGHSIEGANPGIISYEMTITRTNDGKLDAVGKISGDDYLSTFTIQGYTSSAFEQNDLFTFNRVGLFFNNASVGANPSPRIEITNAQITTNVPEPAACALLAIAAAGNLLITGRGRRVTGGPTPTRQ